MRAEERALEAGRERDRADDERDRAEIERKDAEDARRLANTEAMRASEESRKVQAEQDRTRSLLYISQINHTQTALNDYRPGRVRTLLNQVAPDLRGWEWNYLDRQTRSWSSEVTMQTAGFEPLGPTGAQYTRFPALSRNGDRYFALRQGSSPLTKQPNGARPVQLISFDAATGQVANRIDGPRNMKLSADGRFAAYEQFVPRDVNDPKSRTGSRVKVVEIATGREVPLALPTVQGNPAILGVWVADNAGRVTIAIRASVERPDGNTEYPGNMLLLTARPGRLWYRVQEIRSGPKKESVIPAAITSDGTTAIVTHWLDPLGRVKDSGPSHSRLEFWNLMADQPELIAGRTLVQNPLLSRASDGGSQYAILENENAVHVFEVRTGKLSGTFAIPAEFRAARDTLDTSFQHLTLSEDGKKIALVTGKNLILVGERRDDPDRWRSFLLRAPATTADPRTLGPVSVSIRNVWLPGDGSQLVVREYSDRLRTWDIRTNPDYARTWPATFVVDGKQHVPYPDLQGRSIVYSGPTKTAIVYDVVQGREIRRMTMSETWGEPPRIFLNGRRLGIATRRPSGEADSDPLAHANRYSILALDSPDEREEPLWSMSGPRRQLGSVFPPEPSPAGQWYGERLLRKVAPNRPPPKGAARPQAYGVSGFRFWHSDTGLSGGSIEFGPDVVVNPVLAFSPDEARVILMSADPVKPGETIPTTTVTIHSAYPLTGRTHWSAKVPTELAPDWRSPNFPAATFSPDGTHMALIKGSAGPKGRLQILNADTGAVERDLTATLDASVPVAFGPNGWLMAGEGREALVWSPTSDTPIRLEGHEQKAARGLFSADGRRLFTLDYSGSITWVVRVWELPSGRELLGIRTPSPPNLPVGPGITSRRNIETSFWLEGDRVHLLTDDGVRVFDGSRMDQTEEKPESIGNVRVYDRPGASEEEYLAIHKRAESDKRIAPNSYRPWRDAGAALYRLNQYDEELSNLLRSEELRASPEGTRPTVSLFLAMTYHRLNQAEKARAKLAQGREEMKDPEHSRYQGLRDLLAEAEAMIEPKKTP